MQLRTTKLKKLTLTLAITALTGSIATTFAATNTIGTGNGVSFGEGAKATAQKNQNSIAMGKDANSLYDSSIAIGNGTKANGNESIAIGTNSNSFDKSVAIGSNTKANWAGNVAISTDAQATGGGSIAIGENSKSSNGQAISIGVNTNTSGTKAIAVGHNASATGNQGVAIGREATAAGQNSTALGWKSNVAKDTFNGLSLGYNSSVVSDNSVALGSRSVANISDTNDTNAYLSNEEFATKNGVISVGSSEKEIYRRITNVAGGAADHDAVNVLQLKSLESNLNDKIENLDSTSATIGGNTTINEGGITVTSPETGNTTVINGDSVTTTTVNADTVNAGTVNTDKVVVGGNTYITKDGIDANNQTIKNVAPGVNGTDAVNLDQLNSATSSLNSSINHLETNVKKVAAGSAALAALHPLDFDSDDKLTFAVGFGAYKGEQAAAIGAFYRPNDNLMFSVGTALGNSDNQYNAGLSFKFGDSSPYTNMSKAEMVTKIETQDKEIASLNDRLAKLESLIAAK